MTDTTPSTQAEPNLGSIADEITPIDLLYDENQRLTRELEAVQRMQQELVNGLDGWRRRANELEPLLAGTEAELEAARQKIARMREQHREAADALVGEARLQGELKDARARLAAARIQLEELVNHSKYGIHRGLCCLQATLILERAFDETRERQA